MSQVGKTVTKKQRPVNLDLRTIRQPVAAIASILHRVSGVITLFALAILLWLLSYSLSSENGFLAVVDILDGFFVWFILWGILTALAYHIVGGIRHLIMDMGYCEELESGALSAKVALGITAILSLLAGIMVW
ncbi:succinate dehydrogenase cytochrome b556 large subunit [Oceanisphaera marina]|uniref:Succinate dehydrogenase cytochrome b556 subunit n=1 Tax=Oceanisphaera marina TaxID=2017550 RepID=A0ABQ1IKQ4_9GAMM|nr:succinate dehydrogenase cytochrome b556 subunit [Oceanisphaera marina]GGB42825.1 succinate dehydrogenase cytochrome b556 large subunit [Oceanisphaera marina]